MSFGNEREENHGQETEKRGMHAGMLFPQLTHIHMLVCVCINTVPLFSAFS